MIPDSTVYICSDIKLRSDQAHTIYFASETAQRNYFLSKVSRTYTDYTLTRNNVCYVEATLVDAEWWNYVMIEDRVNDQGMMRKFYFVESVEYIDEQTTALHLKLDVMQTFQHQPNGGYVANLPTCWVEREIPEHDGAQAFNGNSYNTLEEPIDTGEYVVRANQYVIDNNWAIMVASTVRLDLLTASSTTVTKGYGQQINGIWSGIGYYYAPVSRSAQVLAIINNLSVIGSIDAIEDMYLFPSDYLVPYGNDTSTDESPFVRVSSTVTVDTLDSALTLPTTIGGYTPHNKKLLQYPYTVFYLTDNSGMSAVYRPEYYTSARPGYLVFDVAANPMSDAGILIYPSGTYKGIGGNKEEGIMVNNFPHIPWISDQYKLWLAQTANTRRYNLEQATFAHTYKEQQLDFQVAGGMMTGIVGGIEALLSGGVAGWDKIGNAANTMAGATLDSWANDKSFELAKQGMAAQVKDHSITPPQSKGGTSGTLAKITNNIRCRIQIKTVDNMHARIIDQYFDHYGYLTNAFKQPNISSRPNWNFVKCNGFDVKLMIPQKYKIAISDVFNAGITFWKNADNIGNYSLNNLPT